MKKNQTGDLCNLHEEKNQLVANRIKYNNDGLANYFKADLDVKEYTQYKGINSNETFALVAKRNTIRTIMPLMVNKS